MIDPELRSALTDINNNLKKLGGSTGKWHALLNGILSGLGTVIGIALALLVIGWILNFVGVIPALRNQVNQWQQILQQTQTYKSSPLINTKK
jgi:hypothetical protein